MPFRKILDKHLAASRKRLSLREIASECASRLGFGEVPVGPETLAAIESLSRAAFESPAPEASSRNAPARDLASNASPLSGSFVLGAAAVIEIAVSGASPITLGWARSYPKHPSSAFFDPFNDLLHRASDASGELERVIAAELAAHGPKPPFKSVDSSAAFEEIAKAGAAFAVREGFDAIASRRAADGGKNRFAQTGILKATAKEVHGPNEPLDSAASCFERLFDQETGCDARLVSWTTSLFARLSAYSFFECVAVELLARTRPLRIVLPFIASRAAARSMEPAGMDPLFGVPAEALYSRAVSLSKKLAGRLRAENAGNDGAPDGMTACPEILALMFINGVETAYLFDRRYLKADLSALTGSFAAYRYAPHDVFPAYLRQKINIGLRAFSDSVVKAGSAEKLAEAVREGTDGTSGPELAPAMLLVAAQTGIHYAGIFLSKNRK